MERYHNCLCQKYKDLSVVKLKCPAKLKLTTLKFQKAPVITVPPVNITVPPGGSGRFDCTAMAATTPQITITKKDQTNEPNLAVSCFSAVINTKQRLSL